MVRSSLAVPRRCTVITAERVPYLVTWLLLGVLTVVLALAVATPWLKARGFEVDLGADDMGLVRDHVAELVTVDGENLVSGGNSGTVRR